MQNFCRRLLFYANTGIRGAVKKFPKFFDIDDLVHRESRLDRVLLVISTCKFCRGCAMQFGGSGVTIGRQGQWFLYHDNTRATHRLRCSSSSLRKTFLSSANHRTLWTSSRMTFGCSYSENRPQKAPFTTIEDIKSNATAHQRNIAK
jgi:hypothetical protein